MHVDLTAAHWIYLAGIIVCIITMVLRKNIVVPAVAATFFTALAYSGNFVTGLSAVFNGSLVAATQLFNIFLVIALVTAMLGGLRAIGADRRMVSPFRRVMRNGHLAFWTLAVVTYVISLFFWPTPAVPLIGAVLMPVAIRAGLSPIGIGMVVAIAGQGMALSSDYIIRVAPGLSAKSAGVSANAVADEALVLSLITGIIALVIAYGMQRRSLRKPSEALVEEWERKGGFEAMEEESAAEDEGSFRSQDALAAAPASTAEDSGARMTVGADGGTGTAVVGDGDGGDGRSSRSGGDGRLTGSGADGGAGAGDQMPALTGSASSGGSGNGGSRLTEAVHNNPRLAGLFAVLVLCAYGALVAYMIIAKVAPGVANLEGSGAAALVGGIAAFILLFTTLAKDRANFLETCATHVVDGLVFAFKAMGVVIPIAGFFFIGNSEFAGQILGLPEGAKAPGFLFDLVQAGQNQIPHSGFITGFGVLIIGMIAGLDGSGFSGLPLTGTLAGGLGPAVGMDPVNLAAIGQMGNIWSGGGVLVAWSSLLAVAGFARVSAMELARKCFIPVVIGLVVSTVFAIIFYG